MHNVLALLTEKEGNYCVYRTANAPLFSLLILVEVNGMIQLQRERKKEPLIVP